MAIKRVILDAMVSSDVIDEKKQEKIGKRILP
jgi:hypothetical protein